MRQPINLIITSMIFFPEKSFYEEPEDYGLQWEDASIKTADGIQLHGWFLKAGIPGTVSGERGTLLFFHGNAGNISARLSKAKGWVDRGFSVLLVDYRGYGKSEGQIQHQEDVLKDARAAWDYLGRTRKIGPSRIILYGESLGTHPAIVLAGENKAGGLILEAPFTSFSDLACVHYPLVPKALLKDFTFPNLDRIGSIQCPVFILHGTQDEICPYVMSRELFNKAPQPKEFLEIPGGTHNGLPLECGENFWKKPAEFLAKNLIPPNSKR